MSRIKEMDRVEKSLDNILHSWQHRPNPIEILKLMRIGLTEEALGIDNIQMTLTLKEFRSAIPFMLQAVDFIDQHFRDRRIFFLGRDAEILFDTYGLVYPHNQSILFPGSMAFWQNTNINHQLMKRYFADNNLTPEDLTNPRTKVLFIDTGFRGTIAHYIRGNLKLLFRINDQQAKEIAPLKLICSRYVKSHGDQLMEFHTNDNIYAQDTFPKVSHLIGEPLQRNETTWHGYDRFAFRFAISLQLLPHFHTAYDSLIEQDGQLVAVPSNKTESGNDIDTVNDNEEGEGRNASVVNPRAAVIAQHVLITNLLNLNRIRL